MIQKIIVVFKLYPAFSLLFLNKNCPNDFSVEDILSAVHAVVTTTPQHNIATKAVSHHESLQSCVNELFKLPNVGWEPGHFLSAPRPDDPYGEIPLDRFILDRLLVPTNLPSVTIAQKRQAEIEKCKDDVLKEPPNGGNAQQT